MEAFRLEGKVALVTGASRGIGRAIATRFAQAGADVALLARNEALLEETGAAIRAHGRQALVLVADQSDGAQVDAAVARTLEQFARIDILVNNAGVGASGDIMTVSEERWDELLDVNLKGCFLVTRAVVPAMREQRSGRIVNISSIAAETGGLSGAVSYSASKGGMLAFTKSLARDMAPYGITANSICPGQIETDMGHVPPDRLPEVLRRIPLGRVGIPDDIACAALFLASDAGAYITGAALDVNGGILMR